MFEMPKYEKVKKKKKEKGKAKIALTNENNNNNNNNNNHALVYACCSTFGCPLVSGLTGDVLPLGPFTRFSSSGVSS
jgi:hypothetical protein